MCENYCCYHHHHHHHHHIVIIIEVVSLTTLCGDYERNAEHGESLSCGQLLYSRDSNSGRPTLNSVTTLTVPRLTTHFWHLL